MESEDNIPFSSAGKYKASSNMMTDAQGASLLVQANDPFGERRKSDWTMLSASERRHWLTSR